MKTGLLKGNLCSVDWSLPTNFPLSTLQRQHSNRFPKKKQLLTNISQFLSHQWLLQFTLTLQDSMRFRNASAFKLSRQFRVSGDLYRRKPSGLRIPKIPPPQTASKSHEVLGNLVKYSTTITNNSYYYSSQVDICRKYHSTPISGKDKTPYYLTDWRLLIL